MLDHAFRRRREIERMLLSGKKLTIAELMGRYSVGRKSISRDFEVIGEELPVVSRQGYNGGYFLMDGVSKNQNLLSQEQLECLEENYKPYCNTLTQTELETLCRLYGKSEGKEKEILSRIIHKYGADKLEI